MFPFRSGIGKAKRKSEMTFARPRAWQTLSQLKIADVPASKFFSHKGAEMKNDLIKLQTVAGALFLSQQSERDSLSDMDNVIMQLLLCENYSLSMLRAAGGRSDKGKSAFCTPEAWNSAPRV